MGVDCWLPMVNAHQNFKTLLSEAFRKSSSSAKEIYYGQLQVVIIVGHDQICDMFGPIVTELELIERFVQFQSYT